jgi:putative IMPACT (imprinted ancient) family translation regulator
MLAVLRGAELTDVVAVVTRYVGGTLLGAGGLVRAYGGAVTEAVAVAARLRRRPVTLCAVTADHATAGKVEHHLHRWLVDVAPGEYDAAGARFNVAVPPDGLADLRAALADSGLPCHLEILGEELRAWPVPPQAGVDVNPTTPSG